MRGTAEECLTIQQAVVCQAQRRGAPWSWLSVTATQLLKRCDPAYTLELVTYFVTQYKGPSQYKLTILPLLLNALPHIDDGHQGVRMALFSLLDNPQYIGELNMELRIACVAALPAPEREAHMSKLWRVVSKWKTGDARTNVLVLAACSRLMSYIAPNLKREDFDSEPVWAWIGNQLRVDAYVLQETLPPHVMRMLNTWKPVPIMASAGEGTGEACCICMEDLSTATVVGLRTCSHTFHARCLYSWYVKKQQCPICRAGEGEGEGGGAGADAAGADIFDLYTSGIHRTQPGRYHANPSPIVSLPLPFLLEWGGDMEFVQAEAVALPFPQPRSIWATFFGI
jgi:hypothetical protein